jgi:hypothetical protein
MSALRSVALAAWECLSGSGSPLQGHARSREFIVRCKGAFVEVNIVAVMIGNEIIGERNCFLLRLELWKRLYF